jgi:tetratricopeptide (TPR) repeat protein
MKARGAVVAWMSVISTVIAAAAGMAWATRQASLAPHLNARQLADARTAAALRASPPRFDAAGAAEARRRLAGLPAAGRLFRAGDYDGAAAAFARILEGLPDRSQAATAAALLRLPGPAEFLKLRSRLEDGVGLSHFRARRFSAALASLDRAVAADPTAPAPRVHRGLVLMHQKRYADARDAFEQGLERGATGEKLLLDLGRVLAKSGEGARARLVLGRCIESCRRRADVQSWGTLLEAEKLLAELAQDERRWTEAEERLRRVLARSAGDVQTRYRLGQLLARRGRAAEATRELDRFRRDSETLASIQSVLADSPGKVSALWWVADAYRRLGLLHLAEVHYRQILARDAADSKARLAIRDLEKRMLRLAAAPSRGGDRMVLSPAWPAGAPEDGRQAVR